MKPFKNNSANISMDFLTAISILLITIIYAVSALPTFFTTYTSEDNYQHLDNTLSVLISHPSTDSTIGLSETGSDIIVGTELDKYFTKHEGRLNWYELSDINTLRDMGFSKHQYYMQILPIDETKFNRQHTELKAIETVNGAIVDSVVRHKILTYTETGVFYGKDLYGKIPSDKLIVCFDENDVQYIENDIELIFIELMPTAKPEPKPEPTIESFKIGYSYNEASNSVDPVKNIQPYVYLNGDNITLDNPKNINLSDRVKITLTLDLLNSVLPEWKKYGLVFEINVKGIYIEDGTTDYNSSIREISEPYKISVWSWFNE